MPFFDSPPKSKSSLQNRIIEHIESLQVTVEAGMTAEPLLQKHAGHFAPKLVLGPAVNWAYGEPDSRYYVLYYHDIRNDVLPFQRTPAVTYNSGILEVKADGSMQVLDGEFKNSNANVFTVFDGEALKLDFDYDEMVNKQLACTII